METTKSGHSRWPWERPTETFLLGADDKQEAQKSLRIPRLEQELMADLLHKLFHYEPKKRLSTEEVFSHEWFQI